MGSASPEYANHQGLCLGFDFSNEQGVFSNFKKVKYQTHYEDIWAWLYTDEEIVDKILFSKSIDWQYEDEYRIIKDNIGFEYFNSESLRVVIFGCRMPKVEKEEMISLCKKNNLNPQFMQADIDIQRYKLNIIDYNIYKDSVDS